MRDFFHSDLFVVILKVIVVLAVFSFLLKMLPAIAPKAVRRAVMKTPNIDSLASEGVRYEKTYTCQPVCEPARSAMMMPWVVPTVISALIWMWLFQPQYGLVKYLASVFSFGKATDVAVLNNPDTALIGVSVAALWKQIPLMTLLLLAGLQNVPDDILEAATIDGAGKARRFFSIVMRYFFDVYFPRYGVETTYVDGTDSQEFEQAIKKNTRLFYLESPTTFTFKLQNLKEVAAIAKAHQIRTVIDNSWPQAGHRQSVPLRSRPCRA